MLLPTVHNFHRVRLAHRSFPELFPAVVGPAPSLQTVPLVFEPTLLLVAVANSSFLDVWVSGGNNHGSGAALDEVIACVNTEGYELPRFGGVQ